MKPRHNIYIDEETSAELEALAAKPGATKSAIVSDALRHFIRLRGAHEIDEALKIRLNRVTRDLGLVRRDLDVLTESLAFFVKLYLTFNAHTPVPDQAAQAIARDRFQNFIDQVGRQIAGGKRSVATKNFEERSDNQPAASPNEGLDETNAWNQGESGE
ncbi:CopG family transcriptional regulator [Roseibium aggregatum]|uniref:ribbon-helix-helix domain-containing protein n=1 Tax=Roseibium aggregatum TaxID=187304 RepID=UPI001F309EEB|nr:CopG family transcriptional regulator [Roseibium aggregatum]